MRRRLLYAFRAFMTVMRDEPHAFVSYRYMSMRGQRPDVERFRDTIVEVWNDQVYQANTLSEAKRILETKN